MSVSERRLFGPLDDVKSERGFHKRTDLALLQPESCFFKGLIHNTFTELAQITVLVSSTVANGDITSYE